MLGYQIHRSAAEATIGIYPIRGRNQITLLEDGMDCVRFGRMKSWMLSMGIVAALAASSAAPRAFAQSKEEIDERCQRRIAHADHELREAREQCWREHHRWWDEHEKRWHEERDWDDRDHDRD
jgi:hypothetical protein